MSQQRAATYKLQELLLHWKQTIDHTITGDLLVKEVQDLMQRGASLDMIEYRGISIIPCVFWSQELVTYFIQNGRNIDSTDEDGNTALNLAIKYYYLELYELEGLIDHLLQNGANPNIPNNEGDTAIIVLSSVYMREESEAVKLAKILI